MPSGGLARGVRRRSWKVALVATVLTAGMTAASAQVTVGPAEFTGRWSLPFEEGGIDTPTCATGEDGRLVCKPVAQAMGMLPDGRVFYFNGLEGQENAHPGTPGETSAALRNSSSRLLDLRSGSPVWATPSNPGGGASNPDVKPDSAPVNPLSVPGVAGVPGRPGDGLVGSAWGQLGGPAQQPTSPPDDPQDNDGDMFCADITSLPDGRLLIAGGADWYNEPGLTGPEAANVPPAHVGVPEAEGLRSARIFDPRTDTFAQAGHMNHNRWYPSLVTLPDGKVLAVGGATKRVKNTQGSNVRRTETFDPATNTWTDNYSGPTSENSLPLSPRLHLMPNGKVLYAGAGQSWGPFGQAADEALFGLNQFFDPKTNTWEVLGPATLGSRDGAFSALLPLDPPYDKATVLTFGGTLGPPPGSEAGVLYSTLTTVDRAGAVREKLTRWAMLELRWYPSGVSLPDGTVLAIAGSTNRDNVVPGTGLPVRTVELFDSRTQTWFSMARISRDRTYHHSAVLLPDGRVLLGGHAPAATVFGPGGDLGGPFPNNDRDPSFEIFTPHYLFRGPRPLIRHVQAGIRWGETFDVVTRQPLGIESVLLMRLPSPQHIIDSDMRTVRLAFTRKSGRLLVAAPPDGVVAPPGYYYLFINKQTRKGPIPSMARIVRIGDTSDPSEALQPFPNEAPVPSGSAHEDENTSAIAPIEDEVEKLIGRQHTSSATEESDGALADASLVEDGPSGTVQAPPPSPPLPPPAPALLSTVARRSARPVVRGADVVPLAALVIGSWLGTRPLRRRRDRRK